MSGIEAMSIGYLVRPGLGQMLRNVLWAVLVGGVIVITPIPLNLMVLVAWIYMLWRSTRTRRGKETAKVSWHNVDELDWVPAPVTARVALRRAVVAIHVAIVSTIIVIAGSLPVKQIDQCLNREITLPKTTMTLGEFAELRSNGYVHPLHLYLEPEEEKLVLRFPRFEMRLGEVIGTIEQQTKFRRRISSCGTGATILWGRALCSSCWRRLIRADTAIRTS
jgi:hypothetical protein